MAEPASTHVVDIPADDGAAIAHRSDHPLAEISDSPGHLLLLKLWHREEDRAALRASALEARLDAVRREASGLSFLLLAFHALSLAFLYASSLSVGESGRCKSWWVPSCLSLVTSLVVVSCLQGRVFRHWKVLRELEREQAAGRALARLALELRSKGASFDLSKMTMAQAVGKGKRMKSSSVEARWEMPVRWVSRNLVAVCLLCGSGLVFPASKFLLCA